MANLNQIYQQLKSDLVNVKRTLGLTFALPNFFRSRFTVAQAEDEIKRLLDTRVERFLDLARLRIFARPDSPYLRLFKHAGCEFADLRGAVYRNGLEGTFAKLAGEGVYFTSDEFKGKAEVVRGGESFSVSPRDFNRPNAAAGLITQSSGTRNQPVETFSSLDFRAVDSIGQAIFYAANDLFSLTHAI